MRVIRGAMGAGLAMLISASGAAGQEDVLRDLRAQNAAAQSADIARQDLMAFQREISAQQDQARTALVLRELEAARTVPPSLSAPTIAPLAVAPAFSSDSVSAQMDRMERLTQDALARSNARVRAVRPASEH